MIAYGPSFPDGYRPGIGIVGCGHIVKHGHLPAYAKYDCEVVGVYDIAPEAVRGVGHRAYDTLDELLADPQVEIVDIATQPAARVELIERALAAGKHVLAQKPLALDVASAAAVVEEAERRGLLLAVNQNARWIPPWRIATLLIEEGAIGEVFAVTHMLDRDFSFVVAHPHFDDFEHMLLYDHCVHWVDISRCWLERKEPVAVRAIEYRPPNQPEATKQPWAGWIDIEYADGSNACVRSIGGSVTARPGCPFWIHGTEGVIRGSVFLGSDAVALERDGTFTSYPVDPSWHLSGLFLDGFAGAMAELMSAIAEKREPYNSGRHNLLSLELTLAAVRSAEDGGRAVPVGDLLQPLRL